MKLLSYVTVLLFLLVSVEVYRAIMNAGSFVDTQVLFSDKLKLKPVSPEKRPDVFLIVMDEYAGFKTLKERYKFDNSEFTNKLEEDGFFVAKNPTSNYNGTLFSTLSMLNMSYLDTSSIGDVTSSKAYAKAAKAIEQNLLFDFFKNSGYRIVNNTFLRISQTENEPFLFLPVEDRLMLDKTFGNILQGNLLLNLPFNKVQYLLGTAYAKYDSYNMRIVKNMKSAVKDSSGPLFMYTHLLIPHSPYLYGENGEVRRFSDAYSEFKSKKYRDSYLPYLKYCNKVVGEMADSIRKYRKNVVIMLVSDHGNRFYGYDRKLDGDFQNFVATYSTNRNYKGFTDSVSLVNIFRLMMNNQFGQTLNILPNYQINVTKGVLN